MPINNSRHDVLAQRRLTRTHGEQVSLYRVTVCSCRGSSGEHADPTCAVCGGSGRAYAAGVPVIGLVATISNQDKSLLQSGLAMPADMTFSPDVGIETTIHDYDVIRLGYGLPHEGDVLTRGGDEELSYLPTQIQRVVRHDPVSGLTTEYPTGWTVSGRTITWAPSTGPANGAHYTVVYLARFDWVVYPGVTLPRIKRGGYLGQRVLLRKRHLADIVANVPA